MSATIEFSIPGVAMFRAQSSDLWSNPTAYGHPHAAEASAALHAAAEQRVGYGYRYTITATPDAADVLREFFATVGESLHFGDPADRAEGRVLQAVAARINDLLADTIATPCLSTGDGLHDYSRCIHTAGHTEPHEDGEGHQWL